MIIKLEHAEYIYQQGNVQEKKALRDINLEILPSQFLAIAGNTGSGKSTLVQLLNGLKQPTSGSITYDGVQIGKDKKALRDLRCRVGLVFQYPEYQLFEETVLKDVAFGPKNQGKSPEEAIEKAKESLLQVGLKEDVFQKSPFDLSGGEKRRAAIAGIMAMEPEVLILDEPTAGLDPEGKISVLELLRQYGSQKHVTIIMVSHNMDEIAEYADRVLVLHDGSILMDGDPHEVFARSEELTAAGLSIPQIAQFCNDIELPGPIRLQEAVDAICEKYGSGKCSEILH